MSAYKQNKLLGQHWLRDETMLDAVIDAANIAAGGSVLEVGPGLGTLTRRLLDRNVKVVAVEKDERLATELSHSIQDSKLEVINADILQFDLAQLPPKYRVAANIPYYLTSALIRKLLESSNPPQQIGLLIQKEVAERIVAQPGSMSVLSFAVQYYADTKLSKIVPANMFDPPPKVDSQIISITPKTSPIFSADRMTLFKLVKAGFGEKRKKLSNSLAGGLNLDKSIAQQLLLDAQINTNARAQELSLTEWEALYKAYISVVQ